MICETHRVRTAAHTGQHYLHQACERAGRASSTACACSLPCGRRFHPFAHVSEQLPHVLYARQQLLQCSLQPACSITHGLELLTIILGSRKLS